MKTTVSQALKTGRYTSGNTSPQLRLYKFPGDPYELAERHGYTVEIFSYDPARYRAPRLKTQGYSAGVIWIYDPAVDHGAFRDHEIGHDSSVRYTLAWRVAHEIAHAQTEPIVQALYGDSRRDGRLGAPMIRHVGPNRVPVERRALTLAEAKRAIHWEVLAFHRQREICEPVSDADFAREFNVNLQDAMLRVLTGEFSNPGAEGFVPSDVPANLEDALALLEAV